MLPCRNYNLNPLGNVSLASSTDIILCKYKLHTLKVNKLLNHFMLAEATQIGNGRGQVKFLAD